MAISGIANLERTLRAAGGSAGNKVAIARRVTLEMFERIVTLTPVDTGRARGNWQVSLNAPITTEIDLGLAMRQGDVADLSAVESGQRAAAAAALAGMKEGDTPWISNAVPYIGPLDGGHSTQAPIGMTVIAKAEIEAKYPGVQINVS